MRASHRQNYTDAPADADPNTANPGSAFVFYVNGNFKFALAHSNAHAAMTFDVELWVRDDGGPHERLPMVDTARPWRRMVNYTGATAIVRNILTNVEWSSQYLERKDTQACYLRAVSQGAGGVPTAADQAQISVYPII